MLLNIYKPVEWTSFDVVKKIRSITKERKVGHGGTLDPFAEGVLIVGTGNDTKSLTEISGKSKSYQALLKLGIATDTLDNSGTITAQKKVPDLTEHTIAMVLSEFCGKYVQIPPMYSAKRVNGVRLYKLARQNKTVKRDPTTVHISCIELNKFEESHIQFTVSCSKGTYVRVLAEDIANRLGTVGHLVKLIRTQVGSYHLEHSVSIKTFEDTWTSTGH